MDPLLYVEEEYNNVQRALDESLRFDYGPGQTIDYYEECRFRLEGIGRDLQRLRTAGDGSTSGVVSQLWDLANRLTLIERSHLGEFSWPFADAVRSIASKLLSEDEGLRSRYEPIIHMIAQGTSYQILSEKILGENKKRRLFTVAFPRQLKHHVLMHALFGHELGHATFYSTRNGGGDAASDDSPSDPIIRVLRREGPLRDCASTMQWLRSPEAPYHVRTRFEATRTTISEGNLEHWHVELLCDLFGLMIFGPAFSAAHRAYLEPSCKSEHDFEVERTSHPAYSLRRTLLAQGLRVLGWSDPVCGKESNVQPAELAMLDYIGRDEFGNWAQVFSDAQLGEAIQLIRSRFETTETPIARRPDHATLETLVGRIIGHLPPIREEVGPDGIPRSHEVRLEEQLYAGWTYWLGRGRLEEPEPLTFFQLNQLCDLALLQQQAIDIIAHRRAV